MFAHNPRERVKPLSNRNVHHRGMCSSVIVDGREYRSPQELAVLVGGEHRIRWLRGPAKPLTELPCLCEVDVPNTLSEAGFDWRRGVDPMEYFAVPTAATSGTRSS